MATGGSFLGGLTSGAIGQAVVRLVLDSDQYTTQLTAAKGQAATTTTAMGRSVSGFKLAAGAAFAGAGVAALSFAGDTIQAAIDSERVLTQLRTVVGENTSAYEAQALALQSLTGVQDEAILSADTILARFELTADQVRDAIPIVLDYAQATGTDVPAAAGAIGKALLGNSRALKQVGISFTATGDRATDFDSVLGLLTDKVGGTAEAFGETAAGQLAIFSAELDEAKEELGAQLLPVLTDIIPIATDMAQVIGSTVTQALQSATDTVKPLYDGLTQLGGALDSLGGASADTATTIRDDLIDGALEGLQGPVLTFIQSIGEQERTMSEAEAQLEEWTEAHVAYAERSHGAAEANQAFRESVSRTSDEVRRAAIDTARFAEVTGTAFDEWEKELHDNFESVFGDIAHFDEAFGLSAREFQRNARRAAKQSQQYVQDLRELNDLDLDPVFFTALTTDGPDAVRAYVESNRKGRDNIEGYYGDIATAARRANSEATTIGETLARVPAKKVIDVEVNYTYTGYDPSKPIPGG